jgi:hypothetical protein
MDAAGTPALPGEVSGGWGMSVTGNGRKRRKQRGKTGKLKAAMPKPES